MIIHNKVTKVREAEGQLLSETHPAGCLEEERYSVSQVATGGPHWITWSTLNTSIQHVGLMNQFTLPLISWILTGYVSQLLALAGQWTYESQHKGQIFVSSKFRETLRISRALRFNFNLVSSEFKDSNNIIKPLRSTTSYYLVETPDDGTLFKRTSFA